MTMTTRMFQASQVPTPASPAANSKGEFDSGKNEVADGGATTVTPGSPSGPAGAGAFDAGKNIVAKPSATQVTPGSSSGNSAGSFNSGKNII